MKQARKPIRSVSNLSKGEVFGRYKKYYVGRNMIRKHAGIVYKNSKRKYKCVICGYTNHIDIAHIKSVSEFSNNALLTEINNIDNLVALCPNHHWEYDHGLITKLVAGDR